MISIPVDPTLEMQAPEVLHRAGLTTEVAVRMLFAHVAAHGSMPAALISPTAGVPSVDFDSDVIIPARIYDEDR
ncbi:type II toxin-antitoxin system RelB/DinJ family antitoxin [uncultured Sphingomonas sp.]|uniref:type II toxin-antitoxin system RelB/DinJ family antitoxin n=1 Tax=uncultured Sphingomonas sp. TaxID=158754 RepID=UPI0034178CC0